MREEILSLLKNSDKALTVYEIQDFLGVNTVEGTAEVIQILHELEEEVVIYHTNKDKYMILGNSHLRKGVMRANKKGFGFVEVDMMDDDIYVSQDNMNGAIHDDIVLVEITSKMTLDRLEGRVLKIIKRQVERYIGEITFDKKGKGHITLDDSKIKLNIEIPKDKSLNAVDGHKVVVELGRRINKNTKYEGKVVEIIGHKNDPGVDILSIIYKYNINVDFPDDVKEEVSTMPMEVSKEELVGRRDLRDMEIFTIDGDDTKDIDDAISIEKLDNGNYKLGVHIADVSYYVKEGSPLDNEAMERGTSVYLVDRVIPMLPHQLSNGICSLNPNVNRLALSCVMKINNKGEVLDYRIFESVICSKKQMTYNNVNKILEENTIPEGYEKFADNLKLMKELSDILRSKMVRRGYLEFDSPEAKILVNEKCEPIDIVLRSQRTGEKLIENFMIVANETVAGFVEDMDLPGIYRVHDKPNPEKLKTFIRFLSLKGYSFNMDVNKIKNYSYQKMLEMFKDKEEGSILSSLAIQTMAKAKYSNVNIGHFGLGSKRYSHFTSPIRRYPDLTLHRLVKDYLRKYSTKTISKWEKLLPVIADHSSIKEQDSINCERDVEKMKKAQYMEGHIGEVFKGVVSGVCEFGIFVQLENTVEGLVKVEDIKGDYYVYDKELGIMVGKNSKNRYMFGDVVTVEVINASRETSMVDFKIVKDVDYGEKKKK